MNVKLQKLEVVATKLAKTERLILSRISNRILIM